MPKAATLTPKPPVDKPPHDTRAEQATLGCILLNPGEICDTQRILSKPEMFYQPHHQIIYQAMLDVADKNKAADAVAVAHRLTQKGVLEEVGGMSYLGHLAAAPTLQWATHYAETVHKCYVNRKVIDSANRMIVKAKGKAEPSEIITESVEELVSLEGTDATQSPKEAMEGYKKWYSDNQANHRVGLRTGIFEIDAQMPLGIQDDMLLILAGRPSDGKTSLMLSMASHIAVAHGPVLIVSLETNRDRLLQRIHNIVCPHGEYMRAHESKDWQRLRTLRERYWSRVDDVGKKLYIHHAERDIEGISYAVRAEVKRHPDIKLVCIDYLQRIQTRDRAKDDFNRLNTVLRKMDSMKASIKRPILLLSQMNREEIDKQGPGLRHLKGTGDIEQDADVVMLLWNQSPDHETDVEITCRVAKQRDGPKGDVKVRFIKPQYLMLSPTRGRKDTEEQIENDGDSDIPF